MLLGIHSLIRDDFFFGGDVGGSEFLCQGFEWVADIDIN
jgi:hypothetical protein